MLVIASSPVNGIRMLAFNRPEKRNALSQELIASFLSHLRLASLDPAIRAIVITGIGEYFSGKGETFPLHYMLTTGFTPH